MPPRVSSRRAFTLIEILVVLTIIIIIALSAMPAMRFIMGSRSIEGTQNIAAAMIGRARSQALADGEQRGVFFFVDPANDRTTMALVGLAGGDLDQYHGWTRRNPPAGPFLDRSANAIPNGPTPPPFTFTYYTTGNPINTVSTVISLTNSLYPESATYSSYLGIAARSVVRDYGCILNNVPANANRPTLTTGNAFWAASSTDLQLVADTDYQILPQGVGVQLINSNPAGANNFDRYLRTGCIMFDKSGKFESVPWSVNGGTSLGKAMHMLPNKNLLVTVTVTVGGQPQTVPALYSQFGLVLYDRQTFLAQTSGGGNYTEGDSIFPQSLFNAAVYPASKFPASFADEQAEENWLDGNSLPLLIDRYNGTLIKGE